MNASLLINKIKRTGFAALAVMVLGSCYLPVRFDTEIELSKRGYYSFIFDGYVAKVPIFEGLQKGKISPAQEKKQVADVIRDLERDINITELNYLKKGHFKVHWERKGDIVKEKTVTFIRRNEYFVGIAYNKDTGRVNISGRSLAADAKRQINDMGLGIQGEIRVITDARVVSNNATTIRKFPKKGPGYKIYIWKIKNIFNPTPAMTIALR